MKTKLFFPLLFAAVMVCSLADAQVIIRKRMGGRFTPRTQQRMNLKLPKFEPVVNLSIGYGFPNLDKTYFPEYYDVYRGSISQAGPVTAALDYRFNRKMGIGVLVTHGSANTLYYDYTTSIPVFKAKYDNWGILFNFTRYIPVSRKVTPYIRAAIGVNAWKQEYTDADGNKAEVQPADLPDLAYQLGLGATFNLSKQAGLFVEAGYGKYIVQGGVKFSFR